ncbi:hypothetical protein BV25DRAFT_1819084 [Artomyces pyxidatus]|uniref:Uncharacterized protein n=1 Tax=Artomyces pyxidatus TaxID=48021 RepID=A0ACB8TH14_9AGAM|nr:hypothetical protein BV25DRAFT_1819084 [Artomyces pyxidatus]
MHFQWVSRGDDTGALGCTSTNASCVSHPVSTSPSDADASASSSGGSGLSHRNLVGVLIIAVFIAVGFTLWLFFGRWAKPIRQFCRGERRKKPAPGRVVEISVVEVRFDDGCHDEEKAGSYPVAHHREKTIHKQVRRCRLYPPLTLF